jgi:hypothetical protein
LQPLQPKWRLLWRCSTRSAWFSLADAGVKRLADVSSFLWLHCRRLLSAARRRTCQSCSSTESLPVLK